MKSKVQFVCQECGYESSQWLGKCPECGTWNSLREFKVKSEKLQGKSSQGTLLSSVSLTPKKLQEITSTEKSRIKTGFHEMDSVLGGGIVLGSVTLLAGDPGIGKSTLLLQLAMQIARGNIQKTQNTKQVSAPADGLENRKIRESDNRTVRSTGSPSFQSIPRKVLYVSGEESVEQIKMRAMRIIPPTKDSTGEIQNDTLLLISL